MIITSLEVHKMKENNDNFKSVGSNLDSSGSSFEVYNQSESSVVGYGDDFEDIVLDEEQFSDDLVSAIYDVIISKLESFKSDRVRHIVHPGGFLANKEEKEVDHAVCKLIEQRFAEEGNKVLNIKQYISVVLDDIRRIHDTLSKLNQQYKYNNNSIFFKLRKESTSEFDEKFKKVFHILNKVNDSITSVYNSYYILKYIYYDTDKSLANNKVFFAHLFKTMGISIDESRVHLFAAEWMKHIVCEPYTEKLSVDLLPRQNFMHNDYRSLIKEMKEKEGDVVLEELFKKMQAAGTNFASIVSELRNFSSNNFLTLKSKFINHYNLLELSQPEGFTNYSNFYIIDSILGKEIVQFEKNRIFPAYSELMTTIGGRREDMISLITKIKDLSSQGTGFEGYSIDSASMREVFLMYMRGATALLDNDLYQIKHNLSLISIVLTAVRSSNEEESLTIMNGCAATFNGLLDDYIMCYKSMQKIWSSDYIYNKNSKNTNGDRGDVLFETYVSVKKDLGEVMNRGYMSDVMMRFKGGKVFYAIDRMMGVFDGLDVSSGIGLNMESISYAVMIYRIPVDLMESILLKRDDGLRMSQTTGALDGILRKIYEKGASKQFVQLMNVDNGINCSFAQELKSDVMRETGDVTMEHLNNILHVTNTSISLSITDASFQRWGGRGDDLSMTGIANNQQDIVNSKVLDLDGYIKQLILVVNMCIAGMSSDDAKGILEEGFVMDVGLKEKLAKIKTLLHYSKVKNMRGIRSIEDIVELLDAYIDSVRNLLLLPPEYVRHEKIEVLFNPDFIISDFNKLVSEYNVFKHKVYENIDMQFRIETLLEVIAVSKIIHDDENGEGVLRGDVDRFFHELSFNQSLLSDAVLVMNDVKKVSEKQELYFLIKEYTEAFLNNKGRKELYSRKIDGKQTFGDYMRDAIHSVLRENRVYDHVEGISGSDESGAKSLKKRIYDTTVEYSQQMKQRNEGMLQSSMMQYEKNLEQGNVEGNAMQHNDDKKLYSKIVSDMAIIGKLLSDVESRQYGIYKSIISKIKTNNAQIGNSFISNDDNYRFSVDKSDVSVAALEEPLAIDGAMDASYEDVLNILSQVKKYAEQSNISKDAESYVKMFENFYMEYINVLEDMDKFLAENNNIIRAQHLVENTGDVNYGQYYNLDKFSQLSLFRVWLPKVSEKELSGVKNKKASAEKAAVAQYNLAQYAKNTIKFSLNNDTIKSKIHGVNDGSRKLAVRNVMGRLSDAHNQSCKVNKEVIAYDVLRDRIEFRNTLLNRYAENYADVHKDFVASMVDVFMNNEGGTAQALDKVLFIGDTLMSRFMGLIESHEKMMEQMRVMRFGIINNKYGNEMLEWRVEVNNDMSMYGENVEKVFDVYSRYINSSEPDEDILKELLFYELRVKNVALRPLFSGALSFSERRYAISTAAAESEGWKRIANYYDASVALEDGDTDFVARVKKAMFQKLLSEILHLGSFSSNKVALLHEKTILNVFSADYMLKFWGKCDIQTLQYGIVFLQTVYGKGKLRQFIYSIDGHSLFEKNKEGILSFIAPNDDGIEIHYKFMRNLLVSYMTWRDDKELLVGIDDPHYFFCIYCTHLLGNQSLGKVMSSVVIKKIILDISDNDLMSFYREGEHFFLRNGLFEHLKYIEEIIRSSPSSTSSYLSFAAYVHEQLLGIHHAFSGSDDVCDVKFLSHAYYDLLRGILNENGALSLGIPSHNVVALNKRIDQFMGKSSDHAQQVTEQCQKVDEMISGDSIVGHLSVVAEIDDVQEYDVTVYVKSDNDVLDISHNEGEKLLLNSGNIIDAKVHQKVENELILKDHEEVEDEEEKKNEEEVKEEGGGEYVGEGDGIRPKLPYGPVYAGGMKEMMQIGIRPLCNNKTCVSSPYLLNGKDNMILLVTSIMNNHRSNTVSKSLYPVNLYSRHWVAVAIDHSSMQMHWMDSMGDSSYLVIAEFIVQKLQYTGMSFQLTNIVVEQQKYNNCGWEVYRNMLSYVSNKTISQEGVIEEYSTQYEKHLIKVTMVEDGLTPLREGKFTQAVEDTGLISFSDALLYSNDVLLQTRATVSIFRALNKPSYSNIYNAVVLTGLSMSNEKVTGVLTLSSVSYKLYQGNYMDAVSEVSTLLSYRAILSLVSESYLSVYQGLSIGYNVYMLASDLDALESEIEGASRGHYAALCHDIFRGAGATVVQEYYDFNTVALLCEEWGEEQIQHDDNSDLTTSAFDNYDYNMDIDIF